MKNQAGSRSRIGRMVKRFYVWDCDGMGIKVEASDPSQIGHLVNTKAPYLCWMWAALTINCKKGKERLTL